MPTRPADGTSLSKPETRATQQWNLFWRQYLGMSGQKLLDAQRVTRRTRTMIGRGR